MMAMSFNENNYSVNYLIWDQETIQLRGQERARKIKISKTQFEAMGQKNMELVSPTFSNMDESAPDGNKFH